MASIVIGEYTSRLVVIQFAHISMAEKLGAIAINPWYKNLTQEAVEAIHEKGFKVYTYTVNEAKDIAQMKAMGVDGIFCNYPDRAL